MAHVEHVSDMHMHMRRCILTSVHASLLHRGLPPMLSCIRNANHERSAPVGQAECASLFNPFRLNHIIMSES